MESWQEVAEKQRKTIIDSIPAKWRLSEGIDDLRSVHHVPGSCGLLTTKQLEITERSAVSLLKDLASGALSSVEVTEAFCGRAAIAQQCVSTCRIMSHHADVEGKLPDKVLL